MITALWQNYEVKKLMTQTISWRILQSSNMDNHLYHKHLKHFRHLPYQVGEILPSLLFLSTAWGVCKWFATSTLKMLLVDHLAVTINAEV